MRYDAVVPYTRLTAHNEEVLNKLTANALATAQEIGSRHGITDQEDSAVVTASILHASIPYAACTPPPTYRDVAEDPLPVATPAPAVTEHHSPIACSDSLVEAIGQKWGFIHAADAPSEATIAYAALHNDPIASPVIARVAERARSPSRSKSAQQQQLYSMTTCLLLQFKRIVWLWARVKLLQSMAFWQHHVQCAICTRSLAALTTALIQLDSLLIRSDSLVQAG